MIKTGINGKVSRVRVLGGREQPRCVRARPLDAPGKPSVLFARGVRQSSLTWAAPLLADVNECDELNNRMSLCKNAKCINTEGSYKCLCLPGYVPSDRPNYCTRSDAALSLEKDSDLE